MSVSFRTPSGGIKINTEMDLCIAFHDRSQLISKLCLSGIFRSLFDCERPVFRIKREVIIFLFTCVPDLNDRFMSDSIAFQRDSDFTASLCCASMQISQRDPFFVRAYQTCHIYSDCCLDFAFGECQNCSSFFIKCFIEIHRFVGFIALNTDDRRIGAAVRNTRRIDCFRRQSDPDHTAVVRLCVKRAFRCDLLQFDIFTYLDHQTGDRQVFSHIIGVFAGDDDVRPACRQRSDNVFCPACFIDIVCFLQCRNRFICDMEFIFHVPVPDRSVRRKPDTLRLSIDIRKLQRTAVGIIPSHDMQEDIASCDLFIVDLQDSPDAQVADIGCIKHGLSILDIDRSHAGII